MIGRVGLMPEKYWSHTLRENGLLADAFLWKDEQEWIRTRNIEFAQYNTTFGGMSGKRIFKQIKKPQDLYKLPSEEIKKKKVEAVYDPDRAMAAYNKTEKDKEKWLQLKKH